MQIDCKSLSCANNKYSLPIIEAEVVVLLFGAVFVTAMIVTQSYGLATGLGTIDRCVVFFDDQFRY